MSAEFHGVMPFARSEHCDSRQTDVTHPKSERIDVRVSGPVKQLLQEDARAEHKTVSKFLLDSTSARPTPSRPSSSGWSSRA